MTLTPLLILVSLAFMEIILFEFLSTKAGARVIWAIMVSRVRRMGEKGSRVRTFLEDISDGRLGEGRDSTPKRDIMVEQRKDTP